MVVLVGEPLHEADAATAGAAIAAYTLGNDVTARKQQGLDRDRHWPWLRCKNIASFGLELIPDEGSADPARGRSHGQLVQEGL